MVGFAAMKMYGTSGIQMNATAAPRTFFKFQRIRAQRIALHVSNSKKVSSSTSLMSRRAAVLGLVLLPPLIQTSEPSPCKAKDDLGEDQEEEDRIVQLFQDTTRSVVSIKDFEVLNSRAVNEPSTSELTDTKVEGTGSGFVWDKLGHIVTNYHVVAKLASDTTGRQRCEVSLLDADGKVIVKEGQLIGIDAAHDLAVLKVDVPESSLKPAIIGTSQSLRVGQSCFAIGNPYGYDHTLTSGVVSGLKREIPSPIGRPILGAIQTDAAINAGNSGGPLIDSFGHVIGVNTATFTRKGSGISSGVNFAVPVDMVRQNVPSLIVYGGLGTNRY